MLKPLPFANAIAATTVIFYTVFWVLEMVAPSVFKMFYNAQFLGANVSSLYTRPDTGTAVVTLAVLGVTAWVMGYVWAILYNKWA